MMYDYPIGPPSPLFNSFKISEYTLMKLLRSRQLAGARPYERLEDMILALDEGNRELLAGQPIYSATKFHVRDRVTLETVGIAAFYDTNGNGRVENGLEYTYVMPGDTLQSLCDRVYEGESPDIVMVEHVANVPTLLE